MIRWRIYKKPLAKDQYMPWWARPYVDGEPHDPRRFHTWSEALEHVLGALA